MAQNEQKGNEYRTERKERLAKAPKTKKRKPHNSTRVIRAILIVICVVAVLAAIGGGLYAYGVPQKLITAVKVGDRNYSIAEYSYYYTTVYQTYANQSQQTQEQYGISLGFDAGKDPAAQTTTDEDDNKITYDQFFKNYIVDTLETYQYYLNAAKADGITLSEENAKAIDETVSQLATYATSYGYSIDRYISILYGKGLSEKTFRSLLQDQYLVSQYAEKQSDELNSAITPEQLEAKYNEDPNAYTALDLRLFGFEIPKETTTDETTTAAEETTAAAEGATTTPTTSAETTTAEATTAAETTAASTETTAASTETTTEAKPSEPTAQEKLAEEMMAKITDEASFAELAREYCAEEDKETFKDDTATLAMGITKSTVKSNIDEDLAEWLFSADRKVGDTTVCTTDSYVYVIYVKTLPYRNETPLVSARHILVSFETVAKSLSATIDDATDGTDDVKVEEYTDEDGTVITNDGTEYSMNVVLSAYEQAKNILKQYNDGDKTEDSFAKLAEAESDDTASIGENGEGGLYKDIAKGKMVEPFENWVYDEARQPGDVGLVMTNYGWHIMYFVSAHEDAPWIETIKSAIVSEQQTAQEDEIKTQTDGTASETSFASFAAKEALKLVNKIYVASNAAES